jgi:hypothetical protein
MAAAQHLLRGRIGSAFELPPGATFDPDPQTSLDADIKNQFHKS